MAALNAGWDRVLLFKQSQVDGGKSVDALIDALARAQKKKQWEPPYASSEERRLHLLPDREPQSWDDLMIKPRYLQALELALPR